MSAPFPPPGTWKRDWHPDALTQHWTLSSAERALLSNKTGATRLRCAGLLKAFQALVAWLSERVTSPNPEAEALQIAADGSLRAQHLEPPAPERLHRLLRTAVMQREQRLVTPAVAQLGPAPCAALDALVHTHGSEDATDADQILLFPVRSALAAVKAGAGAVSVETVLDEIAKLKQLRGLGLPEGLCRAVPATLLTPYRQRAASEPPRELRRPPPAMRSMLLAAFCWQRQQAITDNLVELLMHIAPRVGVRAEEQVDGE